MEAVLACVWSGAEIKLDGEEPLIMTEADVLGIIEPIGAAAKKAA